MKSLDSKRRQVERKKEQEDLQAEIETIDDADIFEQNLGNIPLSSAKERVESFIVDATAAQTGAIPKVHFSLATAQK